MGLVNELDDEKMKQKRMQATQGGADARYMVLCGWDKKHLSLGIGLGCLGIGLGYRHLQG